MNRFYAHAEAGEPTARRNDRDPADPFVVVYFGTDWDFTSKNPGAASIARDPDSFVRRREGDPS